MKMYTCLIQICTFRTSSEGHSDSNKAPVIIEEEEENEEKSSQKDIKPAEKLGSHNKEPVKPTPEAVHLVEPETDGNSNLQKW